MEDGSYLDGEAALGSTLFATTDQRNIALERARLIGELGNSVNLSKGDIQKSNAIIIAPGAEGGLPVNTEENTVRDIFLGITGSAVDGCVATAADTINTLAGWPP